MSIVWLIQTQRLEFGGTNPITPNKYIDWNAWLADFFDQCVESHASNETIGSFQP
jgi:hypothetical protein